MRSSRSARRILGGIRNVTPSRRYGEAVSGLMGRFGAEAVRHDLSWSRVLRWRPALGLLFEIVNRRGLPPFHRSDILGSGGPDGGPRERVQQTDELLLLALG